MHCEPNFSAASFTNSGRRTASVFIETLSAPARNKAIISASFLTPPPTVRGIKQCSAVPETTSSKVSLLSLLAVISRKVSSSAPSASYSFACSTGSPASIRSTKLMPLTTLPSLTSRHGITRALNIRGLHGLKFLAHLLNLFCFHRELSRILCQLFFL